tara:strand:- start:4836 stop:6614 length:1779 start_codon:yes stop_codon:yes gene_type:complete
MKYSDYFCLSLKKMGYTHCFLLQGGSIMHLVNSASKYFKVIPFLHEHCATIAAEYFNRANNDKKSRAWVLVASGPGLTNSVSAITGAYLESRELLIVGGQSKTSDLRLHKKNKIRQTGIQQNDGVSIVKKITKCSKTLFTTEGSDKIFEYSSLSKAERKGPVFLEIPIDIQAKEIDKKIIYRSKKNKKKEFVISKKIKRKLIRLLENSNRISLLLGSGISKKFFLKSKRLITRTNYALFTTWNAADLLAENVKNNFGRPNTWGQRYSNILIQNSDLLICIGTSLGIQQTGFNYKSFVKNGKIINVDIDIAQLNKKNPKTHLRIQADADNFLKTLIGLTNKKIITKNNQWVKKCKKIKALIPAYEKESNKNRSNYVSPYEFYIKISQLMGSNDNICPCSSGGAETTFMQTFQFKDRQTCINNKALASMGYGLAGAIGLGLSDKKKRTCLFEGDGGFTQNLQEIGTAVWNKLNLKIFIFYDNGYASIRMTQKNYFKGRYVGCDDKTGLLFPDWKKFFKSYGIEISVLKKKFYKDKNFLKKFNDKKLRVFIVPIDPEQTYFPKISSRILKSGHLISNPIDKMTPPINYNFEKILN